MTWTLFHSVVEFCLLATPLGWFMPPTGPQPIQEHMSAQVSTSHDHCLVSLLIATG